MASQLEERYNERIAGVLSCYDRVVVTGTLPSVCHAEGGACDLGNGGVRRLSALARQDNAQELRASGQRQMLALLLLLHRRRSRSGLSARAHLGAVSPAILL